MPRLHFGQMSAALAALCLAGAIQHSEELSAMAAGTPEAHDTVVPGQVRVSLGHLGVMHRFRIPYVAGGFAEVPLDRCTVDARMQRRVCTPRRLSDTTFGAMVLDHRTKLGTSQPQYDQITTDTVLERSAVVRQYHDKGGHPSDLSVRRQLTWSGVSNGSAAVSLSGVDTTFQIVHRGRGFNRFAQVVSYRDVAFPRHTGERGPISYPTSGMVSATSLNEWVSAGSTRTFHSSMTVYFNGTRTPEAYLDGKPYSLDLQTGLATPLIAD